MIQIQDDNINPSAAVSKPAADPNSVNQVNPVEPPAAPVAPSMPEPAPAAPPAQDAAGTPSSSEIDQLLADLDKLSKDLDKDVAKDQSAAQVSNPTPDKSDAPISPSAIPEPPEEKLEEKVAELVANSPKPAEPAKSEENFDFDAFLADLEKKIDEESAKKGEAKSTVTNDSSAFPLPDAAKPFEEKEDDEPATDNDDDNFRQNRTRPSLDEDEKPAPKPTNTDESNPEDLKSQNIFEMLGLASISEEEKDKFLDELEDMIWTDFTMHDIKLLLTSEEYTGAKQILDKTSDENQKKEELIVYLEKLIPDLDEVLYEKALELKSEMMGERLKQLKASGNHTEEVKEAEDFISQNRWESAVSLLNQLS